MVTKYLKVGNNNWGVLVNYDFDMLDWDEMSATMHSFGMAKRDIDKAIWVLSAPNTGMAISNNDLRMTAIYIGHATSPSQFWNTFNHELYHATTAIIDYYGEPYDEEPAAYLHGELMRLAVEEIGKPCF